MGQWGQWGHGARSGASAPRSMRGRVAAVRGLGCERSPLLAKSPDNPLRTWLPIVLAFLFALLLAGCGAGNGWQPLLGDSSNAVLTLTVDPLNTSIFFAGTSAGTFYRGNGLEAGPPTRDGTGLPTGNPINVILPDASEQTRLYVATGRGLYVSNNLGDTWSALGSGFPSNDAMEALTFGADTHTFFAGTQQHGVYASFDAGKTWHAASAGLPSAQVYTLFFDSATHTLYAGLVGQGIATSTDNGATWTAGGSGLPAGDDVFMFLRLADHGIATNGPTLYAATARGLYATTNAGQHWAAVGDLPSGRVLSLAADPAHPGTLYAGTDTNAYVSSDGGQHWRAVAPGLRAQVASLAVTSGPQAGMEVYAAAGALYRYPAKSGGVGSIIAVIGFIFLVLVAAIILFRQRRTRQRLAARTQGHTQRLQRRGGPGPRRDGRQPPAPGPVKEPNGG